MQAEITQYYASEGIPLKFTDSTLFQGSSASLNILTVSMQAWIPRSWKALLAAVTLSQFTSDGDVGSQGVAIVSYI